MGGKPDKKTNLEYYNDFVYKHKECKLKFDLIPTEKVNAPATISLKKRIDTYNEKIKEYEQIKFDIPLSVGCKSHLKKVYAYAKYGKWSASQDKGTKYTNKGILVEGESIKLLSRLRGIELSKNEERVNNGFLTGIPDVFIGNSIMESEYIIDIKSSYDIETFMDNLGKPLNYAYWWQMQGYMAITGAKLGEIAYCLVNTPTSILNHEKYKLMERLDVATEIDPVFLKKEKELVANMTFDDIPEADRVIRFLVERDDKAIESVYNVVGKCRDYLSEIEELHSHGIFLAKDQEEILEEVVN